MIKQEIPYGWGVSPIGSRLCKESGIDYQVLVTSWIFRNRHDNAIKSVIIKDCDLVKARLIRGYYRRLGLKRY